MQGLYIGYHAHAGGAWSGDYYVAEHSPFKQDCDVVKSTVKVHRAKEVLENLSGMFISPVAERCQERVLKDEELRLRVHARAWRRPRRQRRRRTTYRR